MKKNLVSLALVTVSALALGLSSPVHGQTAVKPAAPLKPDTGAAAATEKKPSAGPFRGKLLRIDKTAKTISVGKRTFLITAETKIRKGGNPATLADGVEGEPVSGYVKPNEQGKLVATTVNFGAKPGAKPAPKPAGKGTQKAAK